MQAADTVSTEINAEVWSQPVMAGERCTFLRPGQFAVTGSCNAIEPTAIDKSKRRFDGGNGQT